MEEQIAFFSISTTQILGISLPQWIFLWFGIVALIKYIHNSGRLILFKDTKKLISLSFGVVILMYLATLLDTIFFRDVFSVKQFISDHRFFVILISSLIAGNYFVRVNKNPIYTFARDIIFIGLTSGFKTIFFMVNDSINHMQGMSFAAQPYLIWPLFFVVFYIFSKKLKYFQIILLLLVVFMGGVSISRGNLLLFAFDLMIFIFLIISSMKQRKLLIKRINVLIILLIIIILIPPVLLYHYNETAYLFLNYKIDFFTKELWSGHISHSPAVRILEFKNISKEAGDLIYPLFIGKGFGGYFTYKNFPTDFKLGLSDYAINDLVQQKYFHPHTFINFYLLKGGMMLILFYLFIIIYMLLKGINLINSKDVSSKTIALFACFYFVFALNMFWRPLYIFLFGILVNVLIEIGDKENTQYKEFESG
ncbi:MAG: hypothetical protein U5O15_10630 [Candidatus Krumholzibacteriota bacterium]|nr:hypothetical protein [Candidatus Krumholzibacteriota bacterium]